jgi:hypothetical protein
MVIEITGYGKHLMNDRNFNVGAMEPDVCEPTIDLDAEMADLWAMFHGFTEPSASKNRPSQQNN